MTSLEQMTDRRIEARLRRLARSYGLTLCKSRVRNPHLDNMGGYRLFDPYANNVILGVRYELDLQDVESYLRE